MNMGASATPRVDWPEDHACGCSGKKIRRMGTSDGSDRTCTRRLSVYTLCNVVNKCIKNNQSYDEHSSHNTLPITSKGGRSETETEWATTCRQRYTT